METVIGQHARERIRGALSVLSLGEVQLLLLGLWVIGDENRVDPRLNAEYGWLLNALGSLAQGTTATLLSEQAPSPHPLPAQHPGDGSAAGGTP